MNKEKILKWWDYVYAGVWDDPRRNWKVALVKTVNLSVRSFLNTDLQVRAASLTYNTVLALVPALALIFAIGRGFGFQNLLEKELLHLFPAQSEALSQGLKFVDSYLSQASEGIFVGVGILFLLWTLLSLMGNVEDAFNQAWDVHQGRTLWRKITDYTAICLILPVLMICSSGINIFMTSTLQTLLPFDFLTPALSVIFDVASYFLIWVFFTGAYMLIPNTKVKFRNAFIAGIIAGTCFLVLQWVFVTGQIYVAKYNAIYGSFAFLPLLLIWLQLVWTITLAGAVICFSMQNIYNLSYFNKIDNISPLYRHKVNVAVMAVVVDAFRDGLPAPTPAEISSKYNLPANLVNIVVQELTECGLVRHVVLSADDRVTGLVPAGDISQYTVGSVLSAVVSHGDNNFIPQFDQHFGSANEVVNDIFDTFTTTTADTKLTSLKITQFQPEKRPSRKQRRQARLQAKQQPAEQQPAEQQAPRRDPDDTTINQ